MKASKMPRESRALMVRDAPNGAPHHEDEGYSNDSKINEAQALPTNSGERNNAKKSLLIATLAALVFGAAVTPVK
jgi:hypothetical protein